MDKIQNSPMLSPNYNNLNPELTNLKIMLIGQKILDIRSSVLSTETDKNKMIKKAAKKFGEFLDALGCDWKN